MCSRTSGCLPIFRTPRADISWPAPSLMPGRSTRPCDTRQPPGGNGHRAPGGARQGKERAAADHQAQAAKRPGRHLREGQLHHRPVQAPGDGKRDQQDHARRSERAAGSGGRPGTKERRTSCAGPGPGFPGAHYPGAGDVRSRCTGRPSPSRRTGSAPVRGVRRFRAPPAAPAAQASVVAGDPWPPGFPASRVRFGWRGPSLGSARTGAIRF